MKEVTDRKFGTPEATTLRVTTSSSKKLLEPMKNHCVRFRRRMKLTEIEAKSLVEMVGMIVIMDIIIRRIRVSELR